jgi:hypothetical protein
MIVSPLMLETNVARAHAHDVEISAVGIVDDRNLLLAARCFCHLKALLPAEVPCATIASTSAGIVARSASTRTSSPASRAAADVVGPIVATPTRLAQSTPTASTYARTADAEVNATSDRSPPSATKARIAATPASSATDR